MIRINKGAEPRAWTEKKNTPGFTEYIPIPELREALLKEQGFICAYCMRRIPINDPNIAETSKIEHLKSRADRPDLQLSFSNMVVCCPGNIDNKSHCDKLKGGKNVNFDFFDSALQNSISYSTNDATIDSSNYKWNKEINELLNLNHSRLKQNRKNTLDGIIEAIKLKGWKSFNLNKKLHNWSNQDNQGKLKPYCGIVIWYLEKKLR